MAKPQPGYKEIPPAGVTFKPATDYKTGDWRNKRPHIDEKKCIKCLTCWVFCPDGAISWDSKQVHFNFDFCKGCGICANECPVKCIEMKPED
jgi:pyruvate ferredoxin oxidoreductase delta subunit